MSKLLYTDATIEEHSYDAWGNHRDPVGWNPAGFSSSLGINRGYTGHEMLPLFQLINMNGRMYDPVIGRVLAPDNYVQNPRNAQNFNRYSYALNNPLRYVDPTGEKIKLWQWALIAMGTIFVDPGTAFTSLGITYASAVATIGMVAGTAQSIDFAVSFYGAIVRKDGYEWSGKRFTNYARIIGGAFQTDENKNWAGNTWLLFSRFTWESPQTFAGLGYSHLRNSIGRVDRVDYLGSATFCTYENSGKRKGISLGNYININIKDEITGSFEDRVKTDPLFMHEYGHIKDSRIFGPAYLIAIGIPSASKARWTEVRANRNAKKYFGEYYDVDWDGTSPYYNRKEWLKDDNGNYLYDDEGNPLYYYYTIEDYFPTK